VRTFTNYQKFLKEIDKVKQLDFKPSLLLHACCTPCSCYPLLLLKDYFNITVFYNNSNIYPLSEFDLRYETLKTYINNLNEEYNLNIELIKTKYNNDKFNKILEKRKDDKEGKTRCFMCYSLRYKELVEYANENHFDYVCSVMTISRQKNEEMINKILEGYSNKYPNIKYLYSNFKKDGGLEKAQKIIKEKKFYSQNYCGCKFSLRGDALNETNDKE
jgi:predicted adenine nucleotide alpha hydrolase (AANH) superfamily ATPase